MPISSHDLLLLIHLLLFCYWLGGDLGVFYSSKLVADAGLPRASRLAAAKVMLACDLAPRVCMSLTLTVGGLLAAALGVPHPPWLLAGVVLLGPAWLAVVLVLHFRHQAPFAPMLTRIDFHFRWLLILAIVASCALALTTGRLNAAPWIALKLLAFALLVFFGLMVRIHLKGFTAAYVKLVQGAPKVADDAMMAASLAKVRPWVLGIWAILVVQAGLGIVKPGDRATGEPPSAAHPVRLR